MAQRIGRRVGFETCMMIAGSTPDLGVAANRFLTLVCLSASVIKQCNLVLAKGR